MNSPLSFQNGNNVSYPVGAIDAAEEKQVDLLRYVHNMTVVAMQAKAGRTTGQKATSYGNPAGRETNFRRQ